MPSARATGKPGAAASAGGMLDKPRLPFHLRARKAGVMTLFQVAIGGAFGSALRYLVVQASQRAFGPGFPVGTLGVNVAGSLAMGILAALLVARWREAAPFLMTGILGGFTTFSAFSLDAVTLLEAGRTGAAALYVLGTLILCLAAVSVGLLLGRSLA